MGKIYTEDEIRTNMKDAGFEENEIKEFLELMQKGNERQAFRILRKHREELLENLHLARESIRCIDYLTYMISREEPEGG